MKLRIKRPDNFSELCCWLAWVCFGILALTLIIGFDYIWPVIAKII